MAHQEKLLELVSKRYSGDIESFQDKKGAFAKTEKKEEKKPEFSKEENKQILETEKEYKEALAYVKDAIAPAFLKVQIDKIRINNVYAKTFFVYSYPNYLEGNWLSPIINWDVKFDMSLYVYPIESAFIQKYLRKRLTQLHSERSINAEKWLINDPGLEAQIQDVEELRGKLTRGIEKYFHLGLYITIYAENEDKLNKIGKDIETILAGRNVLQKQSYLRAEQGFISTGPFARDELLVYRNISTGGLSTTFPFSSSTLSHDDGILYGVNTHNNSLILFDRFKTENANMCVFAKSGSGKSFTIKLEILRSLMMGIDVIVIDPENEYRPLVDTVWGSYLDVSLNSNERINPFDLPLGMKDHEARAGDLLRSAVIDLLGLMNLMLWKLTPEEESIMEKALMTTYSLKWITLEQDNADGKEIPIMKDLQDVLETMEGAKSLIIRLEKYTTWIFSGIFSHRTNIDLKEWLQVFSVRDLDDILRPTTMYVILNHIWNKVRSSNKKRMLVIDEAWNIMQHPDSAKFLFWLVKRARKYNLWITTITQDVEDFAMSSYGKPIITNSSIQILLKQSTASIDALQNIFKLTEQEKYILLNAAVGQGLFFAGSEHVGIQVVASFYEEQIIDTNPNTKK
jgi:conjugal transfer ATP-binding protein TraC